MDDERDLIDELIDDLNDGVGYVTFDRDVLETDRPGNWGAVELTGQESSDWADGRMIEQTLTADLWVCVDGKDTRAKRDVQRVLLEFCGANEGSWRLVSRSWLYDLNRVVWRWSVTMCAPLKEW